MTCESVIVVNDSLVSKDFRLAVAIFGESVIIRAMFSYIDPTVRERLVAQGSLFRIDQDGRRIDMDAASGNGQTISQPFIVTIMTELLQADGDDVVLEIGTGSGYQAAVLSHLAGQVYTIEIVEELGLSLL